MKIFITENDRYNAFRTALLNIGRLVNIPDCDYKSNEELYNEIAIAGSPLIDPLNAYLHAYDKWFYFYKKIKNIEEETGEEYKLNNLEQNELGSLVAARQNSLDTLQLKYDQLKNR